MKIVSLTDIHGSISAIERLAAPLAEADVVLLTGDLTHFGGADDAARVLAAVREHNRHALLLAISGLIYCIASILGLPEPMRLVSSAEFFPSSMKLTN